MKSLRAREILDFAEDFASRAGKVRRFEAHPYVNGDTLAEHLHQLQRLLICIAPYLKEEFPKEKDLIERISIILSLHDDDEIMLGYDIITQLKDYSFSEDMEEIRQYRIALSHLGKKSRLFMNEAFGAFRYRDTLAAKIAKALDNIAGNAVLVSQQFGLINPNAAKFTIEYGEKVKGVSKIVDILVDAQINQIIDYRSELLKNTKKLKKLIADNLKVGPEEERKLLNKAKSLLKIDVLKHVLEKDRTLVVLNEL